MFDLFFPYSSVINALQQMPKTHICAISGAFASAEIYRRYINARVQIAQVEANAKVKTAQLEVEALKLQIELEKTKNADTAV